MNYYQDNNPFLEPSLHFLGRDGTGKAASDFPLIYYFVAQLWKVFGHHEFIYRLVNLLIFFGGLLAMMKVFEDILQDTVLAFLGGLILFTSPTIVFYANNFLVNVPALGLSMIAWYMLWLFYKTGKPVTLWLALGIFAFAGLLKITSAISFVAFFILFLCETTGIIKLKQNKTLFIKPAVHIIPFLLVIGILVSWYLFVDTYNKNHNHGLFLVGILPIWDLDKNQIIDTFQAFREQIRSSYFHHTMNIFLLLSYIIILISYRRANRLLYLLTLLISTGILLFLTLFFNPLKQHDYYVINLFIHVPVIIITFLDLLRKYYPVVFKSFIFRIIILALVLYNISFTKAKIKERYSGWMNENYQVYMHRFENITPYLRSLGISREDKVLCLPDQSPDISLYFMNQKGWTNYSTDLDSAKIMEKVYMGADYLFIYIDTLYNNKNVRPFIKDKIGEYNDIDIYVLSDFRDE